MPLIKRKLSIDLLGKKRFYTGICVGLLLAVLMFLFFGYFREVLRALTFESDLLMPTEQEFFIYNLFFAAVSVTFGFGWTVWFWFNGLFPGKEPRRRITYITAYAIFWSALLVYVVSKTGHGLNWILFTQDGYDDHLNFSKELPLLLFLLPTVFFLNIWSPIRLSYRSGKWFVRALGGYVGLSVLLALFTPIDQHKLNESWNKYMAPYNQIVDKEIQMARLKGIELSAPAVETIRFNRKERVIRQARELKNRFKSEKPVPTDSVVLELIAIKKTTIGSVGGDWDNQAELWPYALPRDVYRQMMLNNDSIKNKYLVEIFAEYESIFEEDWENWPNIGESGVWDKIGNRYQFQRWYPGICRELKTYKKLLEEGK